MSSDFGGDVLSFLRACFGETGGRAAGTTWWDGCGEEGDAGRECFEVRVHVLTLMSLLPALFIAGVAVTGTVA